jgi:hypothetical protein
MMDSPRMHRSGLIGKALLLTLALLLFSVDSFAKGGNKNDLAEDENSKGGLFITSEAEMARGDEAVKEHIEGIGLKLEVKPATEVKLSDADGKKVIIISSTVASKLIKDMFRNVPISVITWDSNIYKYMGMTNPEGQGKDCDKTRVQIKESHHPVAASFQGTVQVSSSPVTLSWGQPGSEAVKVATLPEDSSKVTVFSYDTGAQMIGIKAPARRVGLFMTNNTPLALTAEGWTLVTSAVSWALETDDDLLSKTLEPLNPASFVQNSSTSNMEELMASSNKFFLARREDLEIDLI